MGDRILVTGANGFVGRALVAHLASRDFKVKAALRSAATSLELPEQGASAGIERCIVGDISSTTNWSQALEGVSAVVHLAARVHVMHEVATDPLAEFRRANVDATITLARQAIEAGVRRFLFLSSIKVNGERTIRGHPFRASDPPAPQDPYGVSKREAEAALMQLAESEGMELCVIRPVLVHGPGVKGNFASMLKIVRKGWPLPLGAIDNRRSLVSLDNLVDLIRVCLTNPAAARATFLVSDGEDFSTTQLVRILGGALRKRSLLLPVPQRLLEIGAGVLGKGEFARRLVDSLQVDIAPTRAVLNWRPPVDAKQALERTALAFLAQSMAGNVDA